MRINLNELRAIITEALLNAYSVLGVSPKASEDEIKAAWKKLALKNHPDRGGSHAAMVDINNAKDRLMDKTALFRYGPSIKGYEIAGTPAASTSPPPRPAASPPPRPQSNGPKDERSWSTKVCPWCGQRVASTTGNDRSEVFVTHSAPAGSGKVCPGSQRWVYSSNRERDAGGAPKPSGAPKVDPWQYYVNETGNSRKFWNVRCEGERMIVWFGRIGSQGSIQSKYFESAGVARTAMSLKINQKLRSGYRVAARSRSGGPPPPITNDGQPKASSAGAPSTPRDRDVYKVYPWKGHRRVVRVGGKLYGTDTGGQLDNGEMTKFNANDRVKVSPEKGGAYRVKNPNTDHSQVWNPIDEVRQIVDEAIIDMLSEIAAR